MTTPTGNYYCTLTNSGANLVSQAISNTTQVWYAYAEIQETSAGSQPTLVEQFYNNYVTLGSNTQLDATGSVYGIDNSEITVLPYTGNNTSEFIITVPSWLPTDTAGNSYNYNSFFVYAGFQKTVETGLTSTGGIVNLTGLSSPYSIYVNATEYGTQNVITLTTLSSNALNSVDYPINLYYVDGGNYIVAGTVDATNPNAVIITLNYGAIPTTIIGTPYVIYATNLCLFAVGCNNTGYIKFPTYQSSAGNIFNMQITIQSSNLAPDQVSSFTVNTIANYAASAVQVGSVAAIQSVAGITGSQGSTLANNYITQSIDPQGNNVSAKLFYSSTALPENGVNLWNFDRYDLIDNYLDIAAISNDTENTYIQVNTVNFFKNLNFSQSLNLSSLNSSGSGNFILQIPSANLTNPGLATGCRFFYVPVENISSTNTTLVVQDPNFYNQITTGMSLYVHNFSENNLSTITSNAELITPAENFFLNGSEIVLGVFLASEGTISINCTYALTLQSEDNVGDPIFLNFIVQGITSAISEVTLNIIDLGSSIPNNILSSVGLSTNSNITFFNKYLSFAYYSENTGNFGVLTLKTLSNFGTVTTNPRIANFKINSSAQSLLIYQNLIGQSFTTINSIIPDLINTHVNLLLNYYSDYNTLRGLFSLSSYTVSISDGFSLLLNDGTSIVYTLPNPSTLPVGFTVCIANQTGSITDGTNIVTMTGVVPNYYFKCEIGNDAWVVNNQSIDIYSQWATQAYVATYGYNEATFLSSGTWTCPANVTRVYAWLVGGGGGGGGSITHKAGGGGGGMGGVYISTLTVVPGTTYTITCGPGGFGGTGSAAGSTGGTTSFGSLASAYGGSGGSSTSTSPDGIGGQGGGLAGNGGYPPSSNGNSSLGGTGGGGGWISIGGIGGFTESNGYDGLYGGGGGGGGGTAGSTGGSLGGAGGNGAITIRW